MGRRSGCLRGKKRCLSDSRRSSSLRTDPYRALGPLLRASCNALLSPSLPPPPPSLSHQKHPFHSRVSTRAQVPLPRCRRPDEGSAAAPPPPPSRTKRTRLVPPPVLTGHVFGSATPAARAPSCAAVHTCGVRRHRATAWPGPGRSDGPGAPPRRRPCRWKPNWPTTPTPLRRAPRRSRLRWWLLRLRSSSYGGMDETCPVSTEGWTRRVRLVREGGGRGGGDR